MGMNELQVYKYSFMATKIDDENVVNEMISLEGYNYLRIATDGAINPHCNDVRKQLYLVFDDGTTWLIRGESILYVKHNRYCYFYYQTRYQIDGKAEREAGYGNIYLMCMLRNIAHRIPKENPYAFGSTDTLAQNDEDFRWIGHYRGNDQWTLILPYVSKGFKTLNICIDTEGAFNYDAYLRQMYMYGTDVSVVSEHALTINTVSVIPVHSDRMLLYFKNKDTEDHWFQYNLFFCDNPSH